MILTVLAPNDTDLYAALTDTPTGVFVRFCRRAGWHTDPNTGRGYRVPRLLASLTVDAPFHLVADRVYDLLRDLDR